MQLILENESQEKSQASVVEGDIDCCMEGEFTVEGSSSSFISCVASGSGGGEEGGGDDGGDDGAGTLAVADLG